MQTGDLSREGEAARECVRMLRQMCAAVPRVIVHALCRSLFRSVRAFRVAYRVADDLARLGAAAK